MRPRLASIPRYQGSAREDIDLVTLGPCLGMRLLQRVDCRVDPPRTPWRDERDLETRAADAHEYSHAVGVALCDLRSSCDPAHNPHSTPVLVSPASAGWCHLRDSSTLMSEKVRDRYPVCPRRRETIKVFSRCVPVTRTAACRWHRSDGQVGCASPRNCNSAKKLSHRRANRSTLESQRSDVCSGSIELIDASDLQLHTALVLGAILLVDHEGFLLRR